MIGFSQNDNFTSHLISHQILSLNRPIVSDLKVKSHKLGFES
jgi:hypothetical protein